MTFHDTQCCAIQEISNLSEHDEAEDAMADFCRSNLAAKVKFSSVQACKDTLYSFYLFTAALNDRPYGSEFEDFIRTHQLGDVWASPRKRNSAFHAEHENQVWIWMPDIKALKAWWEAYKLSPGAQVKPTEADDDDDCGQCGYFPCECEPEEYD